MRSQLLIVLLLMAVVASAQGANVDVTIPDTYKELHAGGELLATIKFMNIGGDGRIDVSLQCQITGPSGATLLTKEETVAVETQASFVRSFDIPSAAEAGLYTLNAKFAYADGREVSASNTFTVSAADATALDAGTISIITAAGIVLFASALFVKSGAMNRMMIRRKVNAIVKKRGLNK